MFSTPFSFMASAAAPPPPPPPVVQCFTSNGTWSCCTGATCIEVVAIGAGGGGDGGGVCNLIFNKGNAGGPGGAGGSFIIAILSGAQVPASTCVIIGAAGLGAPATNSNGNGCQGTKGGDTCFGSCLVAGGGCPGNNGSPPPRLGGYVVVTYGGINSCGGKPSLATITTGTGTATLGNCGGGMNATCFTPLSALAGQPGESSLVSGRGGGAGGSIMGNNAGVCCCGVGGAGGANFTCCGLTIGGGGAGANAPSCGGFNAIGCGGGGGSSAGSLSCSAPGGNGGAGIMQVTQFFT